ncbi:xylulokinase [Paenibacillus profundus]|uniref:Xylulose kinase n=1 Tax=Paenibacillus profundus TaxID=1173085 RepID=A0ABS8YES4_9BACL|nr:xylulokinase [Paenibacillus profundus]MCE5168840.1 xylulokinase [Paenibacillus profundus]
MKYVIGIDLGTSAVKAILVNMKGTVIAEAAEAYPLIHEKAGYSEQKPEDWTDGTVAAIARLVNEAGVAAADIDGISFSGQMHGLVLLGEDGAPLRHAILWNDTRTTEQCRRITEELGPQLLRIAKNQALEGFTLPKLLWVQQNEPDLFARAAAFMLPKDYVRYRLTGHMATDYSDAAGTLLLDVTEKQWSTAIADAFGLPLSLFPPLLESSDCVGTLLPEMAGKTGLSPQTKVYAGGADNACGAIGAGILHPGTAMCSIGTSGVVLAYEENRCADYEGKVHFFNHGLTNAYYVMGVTLAAGYSLQWFKETFGHGLSFDELLNGIEDIPAGSGGLLFTPYLVGERTPHADAVIRGSFIGMDGSHTLQHFARAVLEGITFSLKESLEILRASGKEISAVISIGGGARNETWLQMQADIFGTEMVKLKSEQGPAMGAAMLAAYGAGWFPTLEVCADAFLMASERWKPDPNRNEMYEQLFDVYRQVYANTQSLNEGLLPFRR